LAATVASFHRQLPLEKLSCDRIEPIQWDLAKPSIGSAVSETFGGMVGVFKAPVSGAQDSGASCLRMTVYCIRMEEYARALFQWARCAHVLSSVGPLRSRAFFSGPTPLNLPFFSGPAVIHVPGGYFGTVPVLPVGVANP
jgi:hypothetical protein